MGGFSKAHPGFSKRGTTWGATGRSPQPPTNFCGFHVKKTLILAHCFIGFAMSTAGLQTRSMFNRVQVRARLQETFASSSYKNFIFRVQVRVRQK